MKIYSMTATFGKLQQDTLVLLPGLNVIQAPNEWGKSTWCAFLTAMFYGLDTRTHTTKTALADKDRFAPWSGAPMSGRIDLNWKGRDITIERKSKGRTPLGDFRAYETASGLPIPELTGQTCGQMLLGVEKTVFTRSSMIRLADLPVTQDEALRRRLNALVTTGDDSGEAEALERKLREQKNRCRYNRTGLLPQAEAEAQILDHKLQDLELLESRSRQLHQQCSDLEQALSDLENHRTALTYRAAQENAHRRQEAEAALRDTQAHLIDLKRHCDNLPDESQAKQTQQELLQLQQQWAQLPIERTKIDTPPAFRDILPETAITKATTDGNRYRKLQKLPLWWLLLVLLVCAIGAFLLFLTNHTLAGYCTLAGGTLGLILWFVVTILRRNRSKAIANTYGDPDPAAWLRLAETHSAQAAADATYQQIVAELRERTDALCGDRTLPQALTYWQEVCRRWEALRAAERDWDMAAERFSMIQNLTVDAPAPERPDQLTLSPPQTQTALADTARELQELQRRLAQCQGQMEAIGHRAVLESQRSQLAQRIRHLEDTYAALELALATLEEARNTLQRRFAPRITARAQDLLQRLTEGRYGRLVLTEDLTLQANRRDEETLRTTLWRSDGTADLLYLALRLAVAGELTPEAPLILDDALVRFDDRRLAQAMEVLTEEAAQRQIILFTCHSREAQYTQKKER